MASKDIPDALKEAEGNVGRLSIRKGEEKAHSEWCRGLRATETSQGSLMTTRLISPLHGTEQTNMFATGRETGGIL